LFRIDNILNNRRIEKEINNSLFLSKDKIDEALREAEECTLYVSQLGKKKIWQPEKYRPTINVNMAKRNREKFRRDIGKKSMS
jgi:hypothetical protein